MITEIYKQYEEQILSKLKIKYSGLHLCELGNQGYKRKAAKTMYEKLGVIHTSIDINGRDGALPLNLDFLLPETLFNTFDLITNYGTTEHVNNQYSVFNNIHCLGKTGCVMFHGVPHVNNWKNHCRYYYSTQWFSTLAKTCGYSIIDLRITNSGMYKRAKNMVTCVLKKNKESYFISEKDFYSILGLYDSKDTKKTGNYS